MCFDRIFRFVSTLGVINLNHIINLNHNKFKSLINKFKSLIQHEWWLYGKEIITNNVADNLTTVICSKNIIREKCPLYT